LKAAGVETADDVKKASQTLALFSDAVAEDVWMIKRFSSRRCTATPK
jgi:hypothetical protein